MEKEIDFKVLWKVFFYPMHTTWRGSLLN